MSRLDTFTPNLGAGELAPAGANLAIAEWTADGQVGDDIQYQAPLHRHEDDEAWYVLAGTLAVRIGDRDVEIPAGGAALVPGGTAHTFWNPRPEPARYLLIMGARTYALIQAIHATTDRAPATMRRLFLDHGAELLD